MSVAARIGRPDGRPRRFSRQELQSAGWTGCLIGFWLLTALMAIEDTAFYVGRGWLGGDTHAYWQAARTDHPYHGAPGSVDAFEYSPVFHQLVQPLGHLPFWLFYAGWISIELGVFAVLTRDLRWWWRVPVLLMCVPELDLGNRAGLFSLVLVLGFAAPETWAMPALTKITPAAIGLLWFAGRGEWWRLARACAAVAILAGLSAAWQPWLWREWGHFLYANSSGRTSWIIGRCAVAGMITLIAARKGWAWLLPVAFIISEPVGGGINKDLAAFPAAIYLWRRPMPRQSA